MLTRRLIVCLDVKGGRVVGKSDEIAAYPAERPVTPSEIVGVISDGSSAIFLR